MIIKGNMREQYILAQALTLAIKQLEAVEPRVMRELSNIADMKAILEENLSEWIFTEDMKCGIQPIISTYENRYGNYFSY